jgi:hypothetical protein
MHPTFMALLAETEAAQTRRRAARAGLRFVVQPSAHRGATSGRAWRQRPARLARASVTPTQRCALCCA